MASVVLRENANFTRLSRLLVDKGTEALRNTLDAIHPPANLAAALNAHRKILLKLQFRVINISQWNLLFPPSGNPPDSKSFDVSLLTVLLRNICGFRAPATGWNTMPPDADRSLQANFTRIRLLRNEVYAHVRSTQMDAATFQNLWQKISQTLVDLKIPVNEINDLKNCPLSPEEEGYMQILKDWTLKDEELLSDILSGQQALQNSVQVLNQSSEEILEGIQQLRDDNSRQSERLGEDELRKLAKHNFKSKIKAKAKSFHPNTRGWALEMLNKWFAAEDASNLLLLTAGPGFGKTVFAAKVCELFSQDIDSQNTGGQNTGDQNTGDKNTGDQNTGDQNTCSQNTGSQNTGGQNTGSQNTGSQNTIGQNTIGQKGKLAACHFCMFNDSNLNDAMRMLESLASQMCENVPGFKEKLLDQLERSPRIQNLQDAFHIYLQNPLDGLEEEPRLIVIDGLDESASDGKRDMVKLLAENFPELPACVKVLVTSRPEKSLERLCHAKKIDIAADRKENTSDLQQYLRDCLPSLFVMLAASDSTKAHRSNDPFLPAAVFIVIQCEGSFLYAFHLQQELRKREKLNSMSVSEIMSILPRGMSSVYEDYFHRLETELKAVMKRKPDLENVLQLLVDAYRPLPLTFFARALGLAPDCREMKQIINKVNEAVSCLLYVSDGGVTAFHRSMYDWLMANGYEDHEYTVKVGDGKERLWRLCEPVLEEIKATVSSGRDLKLTSEVKHALGSGLTYLVECNMVGSFSWLVDVIIVHCISTVDPRSTLQLRHLWKEILLQRHVIIDPEVRHRISWHATEICFFDDYGILPSSNAKEVIPFYYLDAVVYRSPKSCFREDERKTARQLLANVLSCERRYSIGTKAMHTRQAKFFRESITAVGVSSNKELATVALEDGTICMLSLPDLVELWRYSTEHRGISGCTFTPDHSFVLYGKLETALSLSQECDMPFFNKEVERFKSCAFSPNGRRLVTSDSSSTIKLWDVVGQCLISRLSAGVPLDCVSFCNTGLLIIGDKNPDKEDSDCDKKSSKEDSYCVWNAITLQRVDERSMPVSKVKHSPEVRKSERCNRCLWKGRQELIPSRRSGSLPFIPVNPISSSSLHEPIDERGQHKKTATTNGIYNKVECTFHLFEQCLRVVENIHFTLLAAWEFLIYSDQFPRNCKVVDMAALDDESWLFAVDEKVVVFSVVSPKEGEGCLPRPTCVLWCSFSPDGSRLATCTSDGFINLWNVGTCQIHQSFKSSIETSTAACWWSSDYLFVFWLTEATPSLIKYPVDEESKIGVSQQLVSLDEVAIAFASFSGIVDFSEGLLSLECGETRPVKVVDVQMEPPKIVSLPGIQPLMRISVSRGAIILLGFRDACFIWKRDEFHSYFVVICFDPHRYVRSYGHPLLDQLVYDCCLSNDVRFAVISFAKSLQRFVVVIDLDTREEKSIDVNTICKLPSFFLASKVFFVRTYVILVTPNDIEIFDVRSGKSLGCSAQLHLTNHMLFHSKLSPLGNVLAVPQLNGAVEFNRLCFLE